MEKETQMRLWAKQIEVYKSFIIMNQELIKFLTEECKDMTLNVRFKDKVEEHFYHGFKPNSRFKPNARTYIHVTTSTESSNFYWRCDDGYVKADLYCEYSSVVYVDERFSSNLSIFRQEDKNKLDLEKTIRNIEVSIKNYQHSIFVLKDCINEYAECEKELRELQNQITRIKNKYPRELTQFIANDIGKYSLRF